MELKHELPISPALTSMKNHLKTTYRHEYPRNIAITYPSLSQPTVVAASPSEATTLRPRPFREIVSEACHKAIGGGIPGMAAMATQVLALMWMRTTINYQYRYGTDTTTAFKTLYKEGGVRRFYRGLAPALIQAPLSRFGDTAANAGMLAVLDSYDSTRRLPLGVKTLASSTAAGAFRILLMPVDTVKTIMQVEGQGGLSALAQKVRSRGLGVLYHGALAAWAATFVGHFPWFFTYNYLNTLLPKKPSDELPKKLLRSAFIGFCSSFISDCCSNSMRVIKTTKQTTREAVSYPQVARMIIEKDGILGLMGRGLKTKILANGVQGICFTVVWRLGQDWWETQHAAAGLARPQQQQQQQPCTSLAGAPADMGGSVGGSAGDAESDGCENDTKTGFVGARLAAATLAETTQPPPRPSVG